MMGLIKKSLSSLGHSNSSKFVRKKKKIKPFQSMAHDKIYIAC